MIKTLLATTGAVLLTVAALPAAPGGHFAAAHGGSPSFSRPAARVSPQYAAANRGYYHGYRGGYYGHGYGYGRRYYLYGVPYFYDPFFFGGFGYYGAGFYGGYPYGYGYGYDNPGYYNGQLADDDNGGRNGANRQDPSALPKAVQKQLAQRGYYKGSIDGEFGPGSKSALSRFQHDNNLRATGRIDPATMKALGFEERD